MNKLMVVGLIVVFSGQLIYWAQKNRRNNGDAWIGIVVNWLLIIGMILILISGSWWIVTHFAYVGGAQ